MKNEIHILILDDVAAEAVLINHELRKGGFRFRSKWVDSREAFAAELRDDPPQIILSDHGLPGFDGLAALAETRETHPEIPFIFVTGGVPGDDETKLLERGATDVVRKENLAVHLTPAVRHALDCADERRQRTMVEAALRESEERFRRLIESTPAAVFLVSVEGPILYANPAAAKIVGADHPQRLLTSAIIDFVPRDEWEAVLNRVSRFHEFGAEASFSKSSIVRLDGQRILVEISAAPVLYHDQPSLQIVLHDLTERNRAAAATRMAEAHAAAVLDTALEGIFTIDHQGVVEEWNLAAERIFGYRRAEAIGKRMDALIIPPALREHYENGLAEYLITGVGSLLGRPIELTLMRSNGGQFTAELAVTRVPNQEPPSYTGFVRDITERKAIENQARDLNAELETRVAQRTAELEAANAELESFSYSISHDLRAPLRHIHGFVEILMKEASDKLDPACQGYLRTLSESAKRLGRLIDELLEFSRLSRAEPRRTPVDLRALVEVVRGELSHESEGRRVEWTIGSLPDIEGDPALLRQVVFNLLSNALKYTRTREIARIDLGCEETPQERIFHIRDNGVGFDMAYSDKLFGVFQRLHAAAEFEGTGIGLANVRRIISRHGGRVWAQGEPNIGATFYFSLPKQKSAPRDDLSVNRPNARPPSPPPSHE